MGNHAKDNTDQRCSSRDTPMLFTLVPRPVIQLPIAASDPQVPIANSGSHVPMVVSCPQVPIYVGPPYFMYSSAPPIPTSIAGGQTPSQRTDALPPNVSTAAAETVSQEERICSSSDMYSIGKPVPHHTCRH